MAQLTFRLKDSMTAGSVDVDADAVANDPNFGSWLFMFEELPTEKMNMSADADVDDDGKVHVRRPNDSKLVTVTVQLKEGEKISDADIMDMHSFAQNALGGTKDGYQVTG